MCRYLGVYLVIGKKYNNWSADISAESPWDAHNARQSAQNQLERMALKRV